MYLWEIKLIYATFKASHSIQILTDKMRARNSYINFDIVQKMENENSRITII